MRRHFRLTKALLIAATVPLSAEAQTFTCPAAAPAGFACGNSEFQNCGIDIPDSSGTLVPRHFCIHVPVQPAPAMSAIFGFHGSSGDARVGVGIMEDQTEQGMVLVAPTAIETGPQCQRKWRSFGPDTFDEWSEIDQPLDPCAAAPTQDNDADLDFVAALMDEIDQQLEPPHHYAWGFSSGANMSYQLMLTSPVSERFAGFGMVAAGMNEAKLAAAAGGAGADWSAQTEIAHPVLVSQGTADRVFFPTELIIQRVEFLASQLGWPAAHPCATANTPATVLGCWREEPMLPGVARNYFEDQGVRTLRFLRDRNQPAQRAIEGVYPDVGHGRDSTFAQEDQTVTVRREWPATPREGSQPLVWLNVIDAAHTVPGRRGNYPPCASPACDIDAFRVLLQFWRANAGLQTRWR